MMMKILLTQILLPAKQRKFNWLRVFASKPSPPAWNLFFHIDIKLTIFQPIVLIWVFLFPRPVATGITMLKDPDNLNHCMVWKAKSN
jgi:hypothetical protein